IPATAAINEALEIAKRYAEPESISFINGILDNLQGKKAG
ncbi:MAG: N utilization substance protein B, partial [Candidatus Electrothrix sp. AR5]|nr:N utilization substance protein B [Candidatus Electrothrix sp. AR5]